MTTTKSSADIKQRFIGKRGRQRLIDALSTQPCIAGDRSLASQLAKAGKLIEIPANDYVTFQGEANDDLFLENA